MRGRRRSTTLKGGRDHLTTGGPLAARHGRCGRSGSALLQHWQLWAAFLQARRNLALARRHPDMPRSLPPMRRPALRLNRRPDHTGNPSPTNAACGTKSVARMRWSRLRTTCLPSRPFMPVRRNRRIPTNLAGSNRRRTGRPYRWSLTSSETPRSSSASCPIGPPPREISRTLTRSTLKGPV